LGGLIKTSQSFLKLFRCKKSSCFKKVSVRQKSRPSPQEHGGRGVWGEFRRVLAKNRGQARRPAHQSRAPQKSFLFLLEEKIGRAQNQKCRENFFAGWRVVASGGGLASLVPFKVGSRKVYNYSTKTNFVGIDCSARRVRRAPQGKIRFCFRRKIPEFAPITI
jgi:hypothetical protein